MTPSDVIPQLLDPSPCFVCGDERESTQRYRVPLLHPRLPNCLYNDYHPSLGEQSVSGLPNIPSTQQLAALLSDFMGLGLCAPKHYLESVASTESAVEQRAAGSVVIFPPAEWDILRSRWADWLFNGDELAFQGLPYSFFDCLPFAAPNYSDDRWFLVIRGDLAGKVFWWSHDGANDLATPWADDIKAWGARIFADAPQTLSNGRFTAEDSLDPAPPASDLHPLEYHACTPQAG